jgi:hypothetical protein
VDCQETSKKPRHDGRHKNIRPFGGVRHRHEKFGTKNLTKNKQPGYSDCKNILTNGGSCGNAN